MPVWCRTKSSYWTCGSRDKGDLRKAFQSTARIVSCGQHSFDGEQVGFGRDCGSLLVWPYRNRERKCRAFALLALHPDPPTVKLHKLPAQSQPQPRALHLLRRRPDLPELLEHRLLILRGDPDTGVAD